MPCFLLAADSQQYWEMITYRISDISFFRACFSGVEKEFYVS